MSSHRRFFSNAAFFTFCIGPLGAQTPPPSPQTPAGPGAIAAIVIQDVITYGDLDKKVEEYLAEWKQVKKIDPAIAEQARPQLRQRFLDDLIEKSLLSQEAKRQNITVEEPEIDHKINNDIKEAQKEGQPIRNIDQFFEILLETKKITREEYRREIQKYILINKLLWTKVFRPREFITPGERREYYFNHIEEFQTPAELVFRQIFVEPNRPDVDLVLKAVDQGLDKGVPFEELARKYSDSRAEEGGLWEKRFDEILKWVSPLPDILKRMKPGDIERKIRTASGWHYFKMEQIKAGDTQPFEEAQEEIERKIRIRRNLEDKNEFVEELKKRYPVQRFLQEVAEAKGGESSKKKTPAGAEEPAAGKIRDVSPDPAKAPGKGKKEEKNEDKQEDPPEGKKDG
ncbi:MAG: SurA N-terminal domain-containing protein [Planctomycetes bacterium]|nr:SurA N-terminal domain-containing protein [Planctomycetota bacterium]